MEHLKAVIQIVKIVVLLLLSQAYFRKGGYQLGLFTQRARNSIHLHFHQILFANQRGLNQGIRWQDVAKPLSMSTGDRLFF